MKATRVRPATEPPGWEWDGVGPFCPCQYGRCGYCHPEVNRHTQCGSALSQPTETPATWLATWRRAEPVPVYEVGHRHRWVCPCHENDHGRPATQLDLFALEAP